MPGHLRSLRHLGQPINSSVSVFGILLCFELRIWVERGGERGGRLELTVLSLSSGFNYVAGCGSGLSGEAIEEAGHQWIGFDISKAMLDVAVEREVSRTVTLSESPPVRRYCLQ